MRSDATEAALGLLGLTGGVDFPKPATRTTTTPPRTTSSIPLKRKTLSFAAHAPPPTVRGHSPPPSSASLRFLPAEQEDADPPPPPPPPTTSETIDCVCGFTYDDGFSVLCDFCGTWVHAACFDVVDGRVPDIFKCWKCDPRGGIDRLRERAVRVQLAKQRDLDFGGGVEGGAGGSGGAGGGRRRVSSPGVDRKRRVSTVAAVDGTGHAKRRRRLSMSAAHLQQQTIQPQPHSASAGEEEPVDIDEPAVQSYTHIDRDLLPNPHTRDRLRSLAQHWRGVTALECDDEPPTSTARTTAPVYLSSDDLLPSPRTALHPLPRPASAPHPALAAHNAHIRPPTFAVRTTQPIPSSGFIAPYTSTIVPSTVYLADPLNSYAHLGMPRPFVHLMGPPLDVALDARLAGNSSRFVRNGCRPNAVLRPVLCKNKTPPANEDTLTFGVFALHDLKAQEEVVLGWEWDDGSVIHHLPALIDSPHLFAPARFEQFKHQMASMLHALSSTFTTCACGASARDCALNRLAEFIDGQTPLTPAPSPPSLPDERPKTKRKADTTDLGPLIGVQRGFRTRERVPMSGGMSGVEMVGRASGSGSGWQTPCEAGPSTGACRMGRSVSGSSSGTDQGRTVDRKGKGRAVEAEAEVEVDVDGDVEMDTDVKASSRKTRKSPSVSAKPLSSARSTKSASPQPTYQPLVGEARLPPKLRKKWIHKSSEVLKETAECLGLTEPSAGSAARAGPLSGGHDRMEVDDEHDAKVMPPPPLPPPLGSPTRPPSLHELPLRAVPEFAHEATSPTSSFANLSLLSPLVNGPTPHFPGSFARQLPKAASPSPLARSSPSVLRESTNSPILAISSQPPQPTQSPPREEMSILGSPLVRRDAALSVPELEPESASATLRAPTPPSGSDHTVLTPASVVPAVQEPPVSEMQDVLGAEGVKIPSAAVSPYTQHAESPADASSVDLSPMLVDQAPADTTQAAPSSDASTDGAVTADHLEDTNTGSLPPSASSPSPAPPTKVKLTLKDFARRRKMRQEEEKAAVSPIVSAAQLHVDGTPPASCSPVPQPAEYRDTPRSPSPTSSDAPVPLPQIDTDSGGIVKEQSPPASVVLGATDDGQDARAGSPEKQLKMDTDPPQSPASISRTTPEAPHDDASPAPVVRRNEVGMTLEAKVELSSPRLSTVRISPPPSLSRSHTPPSVARPSYLSPPAENARKSSQDLLFPTDSGRRGHPGVSRQISQEDGEIFSPPPPKPVPLAPRPRTPPTHPRFHAHSGGASPARGPSSAAPRRPLQPSSYRPPIQNTPLSSRPLPSGPRALRGVGGAQPYSSSSSSSYSSSSFPSGRPDGGPHMAPRGPSADRDRDRMDWDRDRGRMGPWNRNRGGGNWVR